MVAPKINIATGVVGEKIVPLMSSRVDLGQDGRRPSCRGNDTVVDGDEFNLGAPWFVIFPFQLAVVLQLPDTRASIAQKKIFFCSHFVLSLREFINHMGCVNHITCATLFDCGMLSAL